MDKRLPIALALAFLLAPEPARAIPPVAAQASPEAVRRLIGRLGSKQFAEREAATRELRVLGATALEPLRQAAAADDPEVRRRTQKLLGEIERTVAAEHLLRPRRVRLVYRDTPVTEALADVMRETDLPLRVAGDATPLAKRRVTLDTGDTTLWDALAQFCRKAGLADGGLDAAALGDDRYEYNLDRRKIVGFDRTAWGNAPRADGPLLLTDGPWHEWPTCLAGAIRIRALPPGTPTPNTPRADGEKLLVLEVMPEPQLRWQGALAVRVDRAVGEKGPVLKRRAVVGGLGATAGAAAEETLVIWDGAGEFPANPFGDGRHVYLRLPLGEQPVPRLTELAGTLAAQVRTPPEPLAAVDNILRAAGQTVRGADGSSLRVIEIETVDEGQYRIRLALTSQAPELVRGGVPARLVVLTRAWWGRGMGAVAPEAIGFVLVDGRGRRYSPANVEAQGALAEGLRHEFSLLFEPLPDQAVPARLVYTGRRTVTVEVPFILRDVPLP